MRVRVVACAAAIVATTAWTAAPTAAGALPVRSASLRVVDVSGRPSMVTGGDVLVAIDGKGATPDNVKLALDGKDVTGAAQPAGRDGRLLALVSGMKPGKHTITARAAGAKASLTVTDHPITGPVFSGPHLPLPVCTTQELGLGPPTDADCSAPTKVTWQYRSTDGRFKPLVDPTQRPADVAQTTVGGKAVDYIVRMEEGTINRSVYWIAVLDPTPSSSSFTGAGWNRRLVYRYGGGCGASYSQGNLLGVNVLDDGLLSRGYAVATATFNTFQVACNDVLSAETTMMVKEHFTKAFGRPRFTIGDGGSGGAIQQLLIAQNYPGLLDAIAPTLPFPDAISVAPGVSDCGLLNHFYKSAGASWTDAQRKAVNGHLTTGTCNLWVSTFVDNVDPTKNCDRRIPKDRIYKQGTNPRGLRCTLQDSNRNEFGTDPATGFANRPLSNVGVQYGLKALNDGAITVDQFLDLNQQIGGYDIDGTFVAARENAPDSVFRRAYETGRVASGGGDLRKIPVITMNFYTDPFGDIHDRFRSFTIRERLRGRDGSRDANHTIWTRPPGGNFVTGLTGAVADSASLTTVLDEWLTTGKRPDAAVDNCLDAQGNRVAGDDVYDHPGPCADLYPFFGDPRTAAGAPLRNDIMKCRLHPIDANDFKVPLGDAQRARLTAIFPKGTCDWTRPGAGQVPLAHTWVDYSH